MKTIMISNNPKYAELEIEGEKKIEVRKFYIEPPFKVVNYVTHDKIGTGIFAYGIELMCDYLLSGKVAYEYVVNKVDKYDYDFDCDDCSEMMYYIHSGELEKACLTYDELLEYGKGKTLYGWHISDLKIYDKPKELGEFYAETGTYDDNDFILHDNIDERYMKYIKRPPQNFVYISKEEK